MQELSLSEVRVVLRRLVFGASWPWQPYISISTTATVTITILTLTRLAERKVNNLNNPHLFPSSVVEPCGIQPTRIYLATCLIQPEIVISFYHQDPHPTIPPPPPDCKRIICILRELSRLLKLRTTRITQAVDADSASHIIILRWQQS